MINRVKVVQRVSPDMNTFEYFPYIKEDAFQRLAQELKNVVAIKEKKLSPFLESVFTIEIVTMTVGDLEKIKRMIPDKFMPQFEELCKNT